MKVKRIAIGIMGLRESLKEFSDTWKSLEAGRKLKKREEIYFDSIDSMRAMLTNNRLLILKAIREYKPKSIYELARILGRDLKNVNQDLKLLSEMGLVSLERKDTDKRRIIPHVDYSKIFLEIPV